MSVLEWFGMVGVMGLPGCLRDLRWRYGGVLVVPPLGHPVGGLIDRYVERVVDFSVGEVLELFRREAALEAAEALRAALDSCLALRHGRVLRYE